MGLFGIAHEIYFWAGGGLSPEVLTFSVSVTVVEPSGVVTVDSFFTSAFLSQPTENTVARLNSMQNVMIRFIAGTPQDFVTLARAGHLACAIRLLT